LVSLLRRRLHPRAPLFPYTTLFRSRGPTGDVVPPRAERAGGRRAWFRQVGRPLAIGRKCRSRSHQRTLAAGRQARRVGGVATLRDRKSTRLNSSHVKISYAVFCLKK